jgi:hypothetical protein
MLKANGSLVGVLIEWRMGVDWRIDERSCRGLLWGW